MLAVWNVWLGHENERQRSPWFNNDKPRVGCMVSCMHAATAAKILGQREVAEVELQAKCYRFEIIGIDQMPRGNTLIRFQLGGRVGAVERGPLNES